MDNTLALKKLAELRAGREIIADDETMCLIEDLLTDEEFKEFRSISNPKQCGTKDRFLASLRPFAQA